jgi:hypothetical protein
MDLFRGGMKGWGGRPFSGERVGWGTPFSARRKKIMTFQVILGIFVAHKVSKDLKVAQNSILHGVVLKCFKLL